MSNISEPTERENVLINFLVVQRLYPRRYQDFGARLQNSCSIPL